VDSGQFFDAGQVIWQVDGFIFYKNFPIYTITHDYIYENFPGYFPEIGIEIVQKKNSSTGQYLRAILLEMEKIMS